MGLFLNMVILFLLMVCIEARWILEWSDEFEQKVIDKDNWEIDEQDNRKCDRAQNIGRLNCYTNSSKNIRLIDGTLSLVAINEKRLNKKYTSAWIKTTKNFTYGRIDIRAALPIAKMLSPWFKLIPPKYKNQDGGVKNQIIVFRNDQTNWIQYGVNFGKKINGHIEGYLTNGGLYDFHTYSFEWNETEVIWRFDGIQTNWINLTGINTFLDNPVILINYLRVGGNPFRNGVLTPEDVYEWDCSLLTIDYIRYYQWTDEEMVDSNQTKLMDRSSVGFCKNIMDEIRPKRDEPATSSMTLTAIISVISLLLLLALIPLITWLVIRMRKIRDPSRRVEDIDNYYDDINNMEMYEEVNKDNNYEYADYQMSYGKRENYYSAPDPDAVPVITPNDQDNDYITMTSKVKKSHEYSPMTSLKR